SYTGKNGRRVLCRPAQSARKIINEADARASTRAATADAHDDVDAGLLGARRQRRLYLQRDRLERNVGELAGIDVIEVVMRARRRIVELACRIDVDRSQQALLTEQVQRVVDRRLRDLETLLANRRDDLLGRQVLRTRQRQQRDVDPLGRR